MAIIELPLRTIIGVTDFKRTISLGGSGGIVGGPSAPSEPLLDFLQNPKGVGWGTSGPSPPSPPPKPVKPCKSGNWSWQPYIFGGAAQYNFICPFNMVILYWCPPGGNTPDYQASLVVGPRDPTVTWIGVGCTGDTGQGVCIGLNCSGPLHCDHISNPGGMYTLGIKWIQVDENGNQVFGNPGCFFPDPSKNNGNTGTGTTPPDISQPNNGYVPAGSQMFAPWPKGS